MGSRRDRAGSRSRDGSSASGFRFAESLPVAVRIVRADGKLAALDVAVTGDLSPQGAALRSMHAIPDDARVEFTLPLTPRRGPRDRAGSSTAASRRLLTAPSTSMASSSRTSRSRRTTPSSCTVPSTRRRSSGSATTRTPGKWRLRNIRGETRVSVGMPAEVYVGPGEGRRLGLAMLEDVSATGARIVIDHPVQPDSIIRLVTPGTSLDSTGKVVFVNALETSLGMRFVVGIDSVDAASAAVERITWFSDILRLAARYGTAARELASRSTALALNSGRRIFASLPGVSTPKSLRDALAPTFAAALPPALATSISTPDLGLGSTPAADTAGDDGVRRRGKERFQRRPSGRRRRDPGAAHG